MTTILVYDFHMKERPLALFQRRRLSPSGIDAWIPSCLWLFLSCIWRNVHENPMVKDLFDTIFIPVSSLSFFAWRQGFSCKWEVFFLNLVSLLEIFPSFGLILVFFLSWYFSLCVRKMEINHHYFASRRNSFEDYKYSFWFSVWISCSCLLSDPTVHVCDVCLYPWLLIMIQWWSWESPPSSSLLLQSKSDESKVKQSTSHDIRQRQRRYEVFFSSSFFPSLSSFYSSVTEYREESSFFLCRKNQGISWIDDHDWSTTRFFFFSLVLPLICFSLLVISSLSWGKKYIKRKNVALVQMFGRSGEIRLLQEVIIMSLFFPKDYSFWLLFRGLFFFAFIIIRIVLQTHSFWWRRQDRVDWVVWWVLLSFLPSHLTRLHSYFVLR